jgi:hypothetical protein
MKRLILMIAMGIGSVAITMGQEGFKTDSQSGENATPEQKAERSATKAKKQLSLSDDQFTRWQEAALEKARVNEPIHRQLKGSTTPAERKQLHADLRRNNEAFDKKIEGILTADQLVMYRKNVLHRHHRHRQMKDHRRVMQNEAPATD